MDKRAKMHYQDPGQRSPRFFCGVGMANMQSITTNTAVVTCKLCLKKIEGQDQGKGDGKEES